MFWASKALREKVKKQLKNEQDLKENLVINFEK